MVSEFYGPGMVATYAPKNVVVGAFSRADQDRAVSFARASGAEGAEGYDNGPWAKKAVVLAECALVVQGGL